MSGKNFGRKDNPNKRNGRHVVRRPDPPRVSDHAVVRYLQRIKGLDIEAIREEILPESKHHLIRAVQTGSIPMGEYELKIVSGIVVTISTQASKREAHKRQERENLSIRSRRNR